MHRDHPAPPHFEFEGYKFQFRVANVGSMEDGYHDVNMLDLINDPGTILDTTRIPGGWPWEWRWFLRSQESLIRQHARKLIRRYEKAVAYRNNPNDINSWVESSKKVDDKE